MNQGKHQVIILALITAACLLGDSMLYIVLPTHFREGGLHSLWEVGLLLAVNRLIRLPINPFVGWLYTKIHPRHGILAAVVLAAATTAGYGVVKGLLLWVILRCVWGLAWTFLRLGAFFTILDVSDGKNRGLYMGLYNGLYRMGSLFGMLFGGLLADGLGLRFVSLLFGSVSLFALPFVLRFVASSRLEISATPHTPVNKTLMWKDSTILWTLGSGMMVAMLYQGLFTATLSHMMSLRHVTFTVLGTAFGAASLSGMLQALRWAWEPWLAPRFGKWSDGHRGRRPLFIGTLCIAAVLFAVVPLKLPFWIWLAVLLAIQVTATALTTLMDSIASDAASQSSAATVMTAYSMTVDLGAALAPLLGYVMSVTSAYTVGAAVLGFLAVGWLRLRNFNHVTDSTAA